jgi:hypothetical protein
MPGLEDRAGSRIVAGVDGSPSPMSSLHGAIRQAALTGARSAATNMTDAGRGRQSCTQRARSRRGAFRRTRAARSVMHECRG